MRALVVCLFLLGALPTGLCLECYVCQSQPHNKDKCVKTTIQCEQHYDACMTVISWQQAPFWTPRQERIHTISKSCNKTDACESYRHHLGQTLRCQRDWYRDWECVECCQGEKCNYYVTLGSGYCRPSFLLLLIAMVISVFFQTK